MSSVPWRDGDVVMVAVTAGVGLAAIGGAWFGASGTTSLTTAMGWLNLAVAGFTVAAAGNALWLLRLRRAVGERRVALVSLDIGLDVVDEVTEQHGPTAQATSTAALRLVRVAGTSRVHYADCPLVHGKPVEAATMGDGKPCGVCTR